MNSFHPFLLRTCFEDLLCAYILVGWRTVTVSAHISVEWFVSNMWQKFFSVGLVCGWHVVEPLYVFVEWMDLAYLVVKQMQSYVHVKFIILTLKCEWKFTFCRNSPWFLVILAKLNEAKFKIKWRKFSYEIYIQIGSIKQNLWLHFIKFLEPEDNIAATEVKVYCSFDIIFL